MTNSQAVDLADRFFAMREWRRSRRYSPAMEAAVRLMLDLGVGAGEKETERGLHEHYGPDHVRRFGPAPSPRAVRRVVAAIRGGGAALRRDHGMMRMIRLHHVGMADRSDVYAAYLPGSGSKPILIQVDARGVRS